jgi:hypothetical protein
VKTIVKHGVRPVKIMFLPSPDHPQCLRVSRISDVSGQINFMDLPITEQHLVDWIGTPDRPGRVIQQAMPHLSLEQREFLVSGCSPAEWQKIVREEV